MKIKNTLALFIMNDCERYLCFSPHLRLCFRTSFQLKNLNRELVEKQFSIPLLSPLINDRDLGKLNSDIKGIFENPICKF
jgi:hypothetical protein